MLDFEIPHPARMYDYWLGGKTNFDADRQAADAVSAVIPSIAATARGNRDFVQRAATAVVRAGVTQFLDIGTGIPTSPNLHEVARAANPAARVAYLDNDPLVQAHARALLASPRGGTSFLAGDLRDPQGILEAVREEGALDLDRPVALVLCAVLHFLTDQDRPLDLVRVLMDALAPGSYLVASHATGDFASAADLERLVGLYEELGITGQTRTRDEFARFFDGLALLSPGIVPVQSWRPSATADCAAEAAVLVPCYGALARKA